MSDPYRTMPDPKPSLPPYFPPFTVKALCRKCGHGVILDKYMVASSSTPEHIKRECFHCNYKWEEAPLDASVSSP